MKTWNKLTGLAGISIVALLGGHLPDRLCWHTLLGIGMCIAILWFSLDDLGIKAPGKES